MFSYFPHFLPTSIVVIGAGGTGSRLMPTLTQLVKSSLRKFNPGAMLEKCDIYVIDGDIVEDKNLARQNFIAPDVGRNKATVVCERYARAYGVNVIPCPEFLRPSTKDRFDGPAGEILFKTVFENAVVIFAVDSAKARKEILQFMQAYCTSNLFVIDAGNEDDFGQIKTFTGHLLINNNGDVAKTLTGLPKILPCELMVGFIPFDWEYYRNLGESVSERSCADLPQTLAINTMMSTMILCTLQNFLQLRAMNYDGQSFSMKTGGSTSYNTPQSWVRRVVEWGRNQDRDVVNFVGGRGRYHAGTALQKAGDDNGDIFFKLRNEAVKSYRESGMILDADGTVREAAPPPPPKLKVAKVVAKAAAEDVVAFPAPTLQPVSIEGIPAAPPLTRRPVVEPAENNSALEVPMQIYATVTPLPEWVAVTTSQF